MASVHSGEEIGPIAESFNPLSIGCTNVTDDRHRQTTDRRICDSKDPNVT